MIEDFSQRRVLVTGANGFIGSRLCFRLQHHGAKVYAMMRANSDCYRLQRYNYSGHRLINDLDDLEATKILIKDLAPHYIFHCATGRNINDASALMYTNILSQINLLESAVTNHLQAFVSLSSSIEYGSIDAPFSEHSAPEPNTLFGASKAAGNLMLQGMARRYQLPVSILRLFHVYGPGEASNRLIPTAIRSIQSDSSLPLTTPGYNHDYIYIEDVIDACLICASQQIKSGEIFNIGTGIMTSNEDIVRVLESILQRKANIRIGGFPARLWDKNQWCGDISKAEQLLNWQPKYTLEQGLQKSIEWELDSD